MTDNLDFPADFIWGVATAAYQIEGAAAEDGRGTSIWDTFSYTPGEVINGDTGDVACDHYHRWRDDIELLKQLNIKAYRFSIAWPRVIPQGRGAINERGLEFYSDLVDGLLEAGITPYATLYHWDLPQALQDEGDGWRRRGIVDDFAAYVDIVSKALGDRVKHWMTFNEPWVFTWLGYAIGEHAPGYDKHEVHKALEAAHHAYLAHGRAVKILRANVTDAQVGIVLSLSPAVAASDKPEDIAAAKRQDGYANRWYLQPVLKGGYPEDMLAYFGNNLPKIEDGDMDVICQPLDFLGVNYYFRHVVQHSDDPADLLGIKELHPEGEYTAMDWEVYPQGLYDILKQVTDIYHPPTIFITENGAAFEDVVENGQVHDERRVAYLQSHFEAASRAIAAGVPLKGYFVWSLMDNFEWAYGYSRRFGVVHVDYATQRRTIKDSGLYLAQLAAAYK